MQQQPQPNSKLTELCREVHKLWTGLQGNYGRVRFWKHTRHVELQWHGQTLHLQLATSANGYIDSLKAALDHLEFERAQTLLTSLLSALAPSQTQEQLQPQPQLQTATNEH